MKVKQTVFLLRCRSRGDRQGGQGDVVYPIGYSEKPVPDTSIQETDKNLVEKVRKLYFCGTFCGHLLFMSSSSSQGLILLRYPFHK